MSPKTVVLSLAVCLVIIIGLGYLLFAGQKPGSRAITYSSQDTDTPKAESSETSVDLGDMKVSEVRQKDFALKNAGSKPLQILSANSSCMCTFGQVLYKDFKSREFGMHSPYDFVTEIAPGDTATVRVIYRPSEMPVYGPVEREVYLTTNDPQNQKLVYSIRANVK